MSDTPRTDGFVQSANSDPCGPYVYADRCRTIERELTAARNVVRDILSRFSSADEMGMVFIHGGTHTDTVDEWAHESGIYSSNPQISRDGGKEDA